MEQKDFIEMFNHNEREKKKKANETLKKLGKTVEDLE